jgi:DUF4097 and DUF4098 domain-containing protein YvlB
MRTEKFETSDPPMLNIQIGGGAIEILATDTDTTTVEVSGPRADEFDIVQRGRNLSVTAPRAHGFFNRDEHQVRVTTPTDTRLSVKSGSAGLRAEGRYELARLRTGSGDFDIDTVTSVLATASGSGDLTCDTAHGPVRVRTGSGTIEIGQAHENVGISTGSGDIHVGRTHKSVVAKTGSGDVVVRRSAGAITATTGSGDIHVGHAENGEIRGRTGTGTITVGVPAGTPVWTDVSTNAGRVRSTLDPVGEPAPGQPHVRLRLQTGSGDIELAPAPGTVSA